MFKYNTEGNNYITVEYDLTMASLTKKIINGHAYYYARECAWVNGKPKIVRTVYLGKVEDLMAAAQQSAEPPPIRQIAVTEFGAVAALWDIIERLNLIGIIDRHVPKRQQGLSVGKYIALAALNRAAHPKSKRALASWQKTTILKRLCPANEKDLSSQRFWDAMDTLNPKTIAAIEHDLCQTLLQTYALDLRCLAYDTTNFFTFISSRTEGELAQRGHNKQGRDDLRQVGLALLVSTDFHVPLLHETYPGNLHDAVEFRSVLLGLAQRYTPLIQGCPEITLVFDKGNNSEEGFEELDGLPYGFIGSLVPTQHPDLLAVDRKKFKPMSGERLQSVSAYRTRKKVFNIERTVLVTFNQNLYDEQLTTLHTQIRKRKGQLQELQGRLNRWRTGKVKAGKPPTREGTQKQVDKLLAARHMKDVFEVNLQKDPKTRRIHLTYRVLESGIQHLCRTLFGKTIIFTGRNAWTDEEIVLGYRGQYKIENAFRTMKDPYFVSWKPMFHWTDQKIRVHAFYCVLALMLTSLLQRTLHKAGVPKSIHQAMEQLTGIRELLVTQGGSQKKPRITSVLSDMDQEQKKMYEVLDLKRYLSSHR